MVEHEYVLVLTVAASADAEELGYRKLAADSRVDGVILTDMRVDDSRIALLTSLKIPAVTLNRPETTSPFPAVCMDDTEGIAAAVEHLVSLGHTRIGHVGGPQSYIHGRSRRLAWQNAMAKAGLGPVPSSRRTSPQRADWRLPRNCFARPNGQLRSSTRTT
ncbi:HTH-type transcriptional regulator AglR [Arthrobacter sp. Hiyo8]|nr:HTH-type transcriptional regulator AglR [Arthrobacter sp. Hiyo8]